MSALRFTYFHLMLLSCVLLDNNYVKLNLQRIFIMNNKMQSQISRKHAVIAKYSKILSKVLLHFYFVNIF